MKIALIDPSLFTWPYDIRLVKGLAAIGHDPVVYTRNPGYKMPEDEICYLRAHFYKSLERGWIKRLPKPAFLVLKGLSHAVGMIRLVQELRRLRPDVIHFQWAPLALVDMWFLPILRRIAPVVLTVHDSAPFNNNPSSCLQRIGTIALMDKFDRLIVHTASAREKLKSYGISEKKIHIVAHGLLLPLQPPMPEDQANVEKPVDLLLFGQIKPYKGIDVLLRALALLPAEVRSRCHARIVGRPQMPMEPLFELVERFGLKDVVTFDLRFIPDEEIEDLMRKASIQVFPYRQIDASGVLMLALGVGTPIIASNIGLFGELLEDGRHGRLVTPDSPADLAEALQDLVAHEDRRRAAGQAVRDLAASIPDWQDIARTTEAVYKMV